MNASEQAARKKKIQHVIMIIVLILVFLLFIAPFILVLINVFKTKGEPFNSSVLAAMHVYNKAFVYKDYGTGQAEALILFVICAVIGITQVYVGKKGEVQA